MCFGLWWGLGPVRSVLGGRGLFVRYLLGLTGWLVRGLLGRGFWGGGVGRWFLVLGERWPALVLWVLVVGITDLGLLSLIGRAMGGLVGVLAVGFFVREIGLFGLIGVGLCAFRVAVGGVRRLMLVLGEWRTVVLL
ncbi:hypothetical protein D0T12_27195 [Actinomadura spongiicola]|uniref:Uncharacterized protein n=1 Tax=Actinomadura spongiicola TaxID=2303421 RepID=A0A372GAR0_9ACTN|nr:hypothetical protein D0T12_27195 [Actinomadura spongiicola]